MSQLQYLFKADIYKNVNTVIEVKLVAPVRRGGEQFFTHHHAVAIELLHNQQS